VKELLVVQEESVSILVMDAVLIVLFLEVARENVLEVVVLIALVVLEVVQVLATILVKILAKVNV
jgi:hypothetical protein